MLCIFKPIDLLGGFTTSVNVNICFRLDKLPLVTHCAVSSFLSVVTAASQAGLSCHICHLWWMTSASSREELKNRSRRRHRAAHILLDKADWRVFVPYTLFAAFWGTVFCSVACLTWLVRLQLCSSEVNSKRVCVCSFFLCWQLCDSFPYPQHHILVDLLVLSLFMTFLHVSLIPLKCRIWIVL